MCNETDRDLWFNIPLQASDQYVTNLAEGLKFGFDANGNPYSSATANPVYPPLNPNLKAYLELSNEVWNEGFYQSALAQQIAVAAVTNNTAIGQIINYDGIGTGNPTVLAERWQILRTQQISNDFRAVWGNAGMMSTIRPIFQYQYDNAQRFRGRSVAVPRQLFQQHRWQPRRHPRARQLLPFCCRRRLVQQCQQFLGAWRRDRRELQLRNSHLARFQLPG